MLNFYNLTGVQPSGGQGGDVQEQETASRIFKW